MSGIDKRRRNISQGIQIDRQRPEIKQSAAKALDSRANRGHSRDDALTPRQFEKLLSASHEIDNERIALEARAALFICGRLGLRAGEAAHLHTEWMNWSEGVIEIPEYWPCDKGDRDGEVCGNCRRRALDDLTTNNLTEQEAIDAIRHVIEDGQMEPLSDADVLEKSVALRGDVNITYDEALEKRWQPKTPQSARTVPFDFDVRIELCLESFFEKFDGWERSVCTLNRRIDRLADIAEIDQNVYPHCLRATAASTHASRDISVYALMSVLGWSDPSTARMYVQSNHEQANREIRSKHR
jgi:integrase